jgi:hypothetical protein
MPGLRKTAEKEKGMKSGSTTISRGRVYSVDPAAIAAIVLALLTFALPCSVWGGVTKGGVEGYVRDENGNPLPGVGVMFAGAYVSDDHTVVAAFVWNGNYSMYDRRLSVHTTKTDGTGHFSMKGLVPGAYAFYGTGEAWHKYVIHTEGNLVIVGGQKTHFDVVARTKTPQAPK